MKSLIHPVGDSISRTPESGKAKIATTLPATRSLPALENLDR